MLAMPLEKTRKSGRADEAVAVVGPAIFGNGDELAREECVVRGDAGGGGGPGAGVAAVAAVLLGARKDVGGLEREGVGGVRRGGGRLGERGRGRR